MSNYMETAGVEPEWEPASLRHVFILITILILSACHAQFLALSTLDYASKLALVWSTMVTFQVLYLFFLTWATAEREYGRISRLVSFSGLLTLTVSLHWKSQFFSGPLTLLGPPIPMFWLVFPSNTQ